MPSALMQGRVCPAPYLAGSRVASRTLNRPLPLDGGVGKPVPPEPPVCYTLQRFPPRAIPAAPECADAVSRDTLPPPPGETCICPCCGLKLHVPDTLAGRQV